MVGMLSSKDLEHFRRLLLADRSTVESRIQARTEELGGTDDQGTSDAGDEAQSIASRERAIDDNDADRDLLGRIDRALSRLDAGTYGVSEVSGKPIPTERLEALPTATTLVDEAPPDS
jgi:DnaK suppressor protein